MSVEISGELEGLDQVLRRFRKAPQVFGRYMRTFLQKALVLIERVVKQKTPVNLGVLRSSVGHEIQGVGARMQGVVGSPKDYAPFVELDTRPHWPPQRPIMYWVMRKLKLTGVALRQATRGVQRKIARQGTKGKHMFEQAFEETKGRVGELWASIWGEAVTKEL